MNLPAQQAAASGAARAAVALFLLGALLAGAAAAQQRPFGDGEHLLSLRNPRGEGEPLRRYWSVVVPAQPFAYERALRQDPRFQDDFPYQTWGLVWERPGEAKTRRVFVHYQLPEQEELARRVTATLVKIYWLAREYLGAQPPAAERRFQHDPQVHVWLRRDGPPGAEEWQGHLYLYSVQTPRAPAEWIRQIAHEYGHAVLPRLGPYAEPEQWANGLIGERLFLKWLIDNGETATWGEPFSGPNYLANEVLPLIADYLNEGPHSPVLNQTHGAGMERLTGAALAVEATYGPAVLRAALARLRPEEQPSAFLRVVGEALAADPPDRIALDAGLFAPARSSGARATAEGWSFERALYWLYLPPGEWEIRVRGTPPAAMELERVPLARDDGPGAFHGSVTVGAWRRLELAGAEGQPLTVRRLEFRRGGGTDGPRRFSARSPRVN